MARKYHTVVEFDTEARAWFDVFGSYSKTEAQEEAQCGKDDGKMCKVITHDDTANAMMAARDALPVPAKYRKAVLAAQAAIETLRQCQQG